MINFKKVFRTDFTILRLAGTWIGPDNKRIPRWYKCYAFLTHTNTCIFVTTLVINWILNSTTIKSSASFGYVVMTAITGQLKGLLLAKNNKYAAILFEDYDTEQFQVKSKDELQIVNQKLSQNFIIRTILRGGVGLCLILLVFKPIISGTIKNLILPAWFPFDVTISPYCQIVYLHQIIGLTALATCNACGDALMASLCLFIGVQCKLLSHRLVKVGEDGQHQQQLLDCMNHYHHILKYLDTTNKVFDTIYSLQFFATTASMCMDLFLLSVVDPGTYEFIFYVSYLLGIMNMLLLPCWFASEMTKNSEDISTAGYCCNWVDASNRYKKDLGIFMCRSQKALKLYGANFFEVSVVTFLAVVRASMSYFAVMRNLTTSENE